MTPQQAEARIRQIDEKYDGAFGERLKNVGMLLDEALNDLDRAIASGNAREEELSRDAAILIGDWERTLQRARDEIESACGPAIAPNRDLII